ncbi:MAG: hypothetical protein RR500_07900 [Bacilli bacterium]
MLKTIQSIPLSLTDGTKILISKDDIKKLDSGSFVIHTDDYLIFVFPTKSGSYISKVEDVPIVSTYTDFDNSNPNLEKSPLSKESIDLIISLNLT